MALLYAKASDGYLASIPVNIMGYVELRNTKNGWQYLPNGAIIEWGGTTWGPSNYEGTKTVILPITVSSIFSAIGILITPSSKHSNSALQLYQKSVGSIVFNVQSMTDIGESHGLQYLVIGKCDNTAVQNKLIIKILGVVQANVEVLIDSVSYTTNASGEIILSQVLNSNITYIVKCGNYVSTINIIYDGITSYMIDLILLQYTVTIRGTDTDDQKLCVIYNGTTYTNNATLSVASGSSLTIESISIIPWTGRHPGAIYINGKSTGTTRYTYTVTDNVSISNGSSYS